MSLWRATIRPTEINERRRGTLPRISILAFEIAKHPNAAILMLLTLTSRFSQPFAVRGRGQIGNYNARHDEVFRSSSVVKPHEDIVKRRAHEMLGLRTEHPLRSFGLIALNLNRNLAASVGTRRQNIDAACVT